MNAFAELLDILPNIVVTKQLVDFFHYSFRVGHLSGTIIAKLKPIAKLVS